MLWLRRRSDVQAIVFRVQDCQEVLKTADCRCLVTRSWKVIWRALNTCILMVIPMTILASGVPHPAFFIFVRAADTMNKRDFLKSSGALVAGSMLSRFSPAEQHAEPRENWA